MNEIQDMINNIDFNNLTYCYTSPNIASINFIRFKDPMHFYNDIKNVWIKMIWIKNDINNVSIKKKRKRFKNNLN